MIIQEMEVPWSKVRSVRSRPSPSQKHLERKVASLMADQEEWQAKASLALSKDREDLAKAALPGQIASRPGNPDPGKASRTGRCRSGQAERGRRGPAAEAGDAKSREATLIARHKTATNRLKIRNSLYDERVTDAFAVSSRWRSR